MLCQTCPKRNICRSSCNLLEENLARIERPQTEILKTSNQLERIAGKLAASEFLRNNNNSEEEIENREEEEESRLRYQSLHRSFEELTPRQMVCVELFYWDDLSYREISAQLGVSRQAVAKHLESAYTIIQKYLIGSLKVGCNSALYK